MGVVPARGRVRQRMAAEKAAAVQRCQCSSIVLAVGGAGCAVMEMDGGSGCTVLYVPAGWRRLVPAMSRCCALDVRVAVYAGE